MFAVGILTSCGTDSKHDNKANESNASEAKSPVKSAKTQLNVEGVNIPEGVSLDTINLKLNGVGVRNKFHLKVYVAALYLPNKNNNPKDVINKNEPQAIALHMTSILMTSSNMSKYISEGFYRSTNGKVAPIQKQIDLALSIFNSEPVSKFDKFEMFYIPEENGVKAYKNGKFLAFIPGGVEFKKAMFGIWLSDDPVDADLKDGILGLKNPND